MPDHIHTIPVLDALRDPGDCAFCAMEQKLTNDAINFVMGPSYMEDDVRAETDISGFCKPHLDAMYQHQNRLGLALMLHTHVEKMIKDTNKIIEGRVPLPLFGKTPEAVLPRLEQKFAKTNTSCYVCNKVQNTFVHYMDTFLYIWGKGGEDARRIEGQKGYCFQHMQQIFAAVDKLGRGKKEKFTTVLTEQLKNSLALLEEDLSWFVQKFDHRNANEPWKNSKDALPRAINITGGTK